MIDKLPIEVALAIAQHLTPREQSESTLTCSSWCQWFRKNGLFKKISLKTTAAELEEPSVADRACLPMLDFFQEQKYGHFVSELDVSLDTMSHQEFIRLPAVFPNIRKLKVQGEVPMSTVEESESSAMAIKQHWKQIEEISDDSEFHRLAFILINENQRSNSNLKDITLGYPIHNSGPDPDSYEYWEAEEPKVSLPVQLTRQLRSLTLLNSTFTFDTLKAERYVINVPTLRLLNLMVCDGQEMEAYWEHNKQLKPTRPNDIQSANVRHLEVTADPTSFKYYTIVRWLDYFTDAFPNLESFSFNYAESVYDRPILQASERSLIKEAKFMAGRQKLKKYSMQFGCFTQHTLDTMNACKVALEDLTLFIDQATTDQFTRIKNSSQTKSLTRLTIKETGKYTDEQGVYGLEMFALLEHLPQLKEIEIDTGRGSYLRHNPAVIVSLLNSAPHVVSIKAPDLTAIPIHENIILSQPSQLVHLEISYCQFVLSKTTAQKTNQVFKNIFSQCPVLETFSTQVNVYKAQDDMDQGIALVFSFTEQSNMKSIKIQSLYKTYFKLIINNITTCFHQKYDEMRQAVPAVDENEVYIQIEAPNAYMIDTTIMDGC